MQPIMIPKPTSYMLSMSKSNNVRLITVSVMKSSNSSHTSRKSVSQESFSMSSKDDRIAAFFIH